MSESKRTTRRCSVCEKLFVPAKKIYGGFIHTCDQCSFESEPDDFVKKIGRVDRYVGRMTEKGNEGIIIFRSDIASHKSQLMMEAKRGMSPNILITSPVNELVRQSEKEGKEVDREAGSTIEEMIDNLRKKEP